MVYRRAGKKRGLKLHIQEKYSALSTAAILQHRRYDESYQINRWRLFHVKTANHLLYHVLMAFKIARSKTALFQYMLCQRPYDMP